MPSAEWTTDEIADLIRACRRLGVPHFRLGDLEFRVDLASRARASGTKTETVTDADADESDPIDDGEDEPEDWRVARDRRYSEARKGGGSR